MKIMKFSTLKTSSSLHQQVHPWKLWSKILDHFCPAWPLSCDDIFQAKSFQEPQKLKMFLFLEDLQTQTDMNKFSAIINHNLPAPTRTYSTSLSHSFNKFGNSIFCWIFVQNSPVVMIIPKQVEIMYGMFIVT